MSSGIFSRRRPVAAYRARFAAHWQRFLRETFDSPEHVAVAFAVEGSTARKWWEGSHAPSGFAVAVAHRLAPAAAARAFDPEADA
jgi:hypothetical protein